MPSLNFPFLQIERVHLMDVDIVTPHAELDGYVNEFIAGIPVDWDVMIEDKDGRQLLNTLYTVRFTGTRQDLKRLYDRIVEAPTFDGNTTIELGTM